MANIQGNVVAGFNKSLQTLLYFHIEEKEAGSSPSSPSSATGGDGGGGARLQPAVQADARSPGPFGYAEVGVDQRSVLLQGPDEARPPDVELFADPCFRSGMVGAVGDGGPQRPEEPSEWRVKDGNDDDAADVLIIVAADTEADLAHEVQEGRGPGRGGQRGAPDRE